MATNPPTVDELIDAVIGREGGYSNHPADRGGPTRYGITEATARANGYKGDMRVFPRVSAVAIYSRIYWTGPRLDAIARRYPAVAAELFDIGVNMGPATGIGFLQRGLNAFNDGGKIYNDIAKDGKAGPGTLAALDGYLAKRGAAGEDELLEAVRSMRGERYIAICESRPANEAFTFGWFGRMTEMLKARFKPSGAGAAIVLAMLVLLTGCAVAPVRPLPAQPSTAQPSALLLQRASLAVDRLILLNAAAQRAVAIFRPWLPPERADRVDAIAIRVDAAIKAVSVARDLTTQDDAISAVETLIAEMKWIAGA